MNNKGQYYLFVAIILCLTSYGLIYTSVNAKDKPNTFDDITQNYLNEAKNVINNGIYNEEDLFLHFDNFTNKFISFSKTKAINFQLLYLLKSDNQIRVVNYLDQSVLLNSNRTLYQREYVTLNPQDLITINYNDIIYNYTFSDDDVEFKALFTIQ